jgi:hypothetical protein
MRCGSYQNNNKRTNEFFFFFSYSFGYVHPGPKGVKCWLMTIFFLKKKKRMLCVCVQVRLHASRTDAERLP